MTLEHAWTPPSSARPGGDDKKRKWTLGSVDLPAITRTYTEQDELFVLPNALAGDGVGRLVAAAERLRPCAVRKTVPGYKKSASVGARDIGELAPELVTLYESPELIGLLSEVAGANLFPCPERDPHRVALYYYTEAGDGIGWHFDSSHYKGQRFTVLIGVVNRTTESKLLCKLYEKIPSREKVDLNVATEPGMLIFFNGDRLYHAVSKLAANEERIVLTLEYVTDTRMNPVRRWISDFKDAATYFGFRRKARK
jgi:hypothetical protein